MNVSTFPNILRVLLISLTLGSFSCKDGQDGNTKAATTGHEKIIDILKEVNQKLQKSNNIYASEARIAECDSRLAATQDPAQRLQIQFSKAQYLIEFGDEAQAISILEQLLAQIKDVPEARKSFLPVLGLAYMRLAERSNCVNNHSTDACILPIQGNGVHLNKDPARKAIAVFEEILKGDPQNLDIRWVLNIMYMTVGEYPQQMPKAWLIPGLEAPTSATSIKPFRDMAPDLRLNYRDRSGGVIVDDFDNDDYLDIVTSAWGLDDPMHYFHNKGDGTFSNASNTSGLSKYMGGLNLTQTDYNNDGYLDIFVLRGAWQGQIGLGEQPNSLIRNNGDGTFTDVTIESGILSFHPTQTATWNDFNKDGWLDVFIGNESYDIKTSHPCELYLNNQNGTFTNIAKPGILDISVFAKGVTSGDYDNDGWPDIFISSLDGYKLLLRNTGLQGKEPRFEMMSAFAGFGKEMSKTFPTWFFDYDNDGWLDLFLCNYEFEGHLSKYAAREALRPSSDRAGKIEIYHNLQNGKFENMSAKMNLNQTVFAMGSNFGDIDNDGYLDFYLGTGNPSYLSLIPNKMYKNLGGKDFADVTSSARVGNLQKGHGVAFGDLNNNGDQDIFAEMGGAFRGDAYYTSFYLNPGQSNNNWICLKLEGKRSNRAAIGAKITVKFQENGKARMVCRDVNSGGSFGASTLRREIGIGQATSIDEIAVTWPVTGITQVFKNVVPNQFLKIVEGQDNVEKLSVKGLVFKAADGSIPMCAPLK